MIKSTLSQVGVYLATTFNLPRTQVGYTEKGSLFRHLKEENLPITLPSVSFYNSEITFNNLSGTVRKKSPFVGGTSLNQTTTQRYNLLPIVLNISIALVSSTLKDYFESIKNYAVLFKTALLIVPLIIDKESIDMQSSISNILPLTTPVEGKEGFDYDRGLFYVIEGGFSVNSGVLFDTEDKLIRAIESNIELTVL